MLGVFFFFFLPFFFFFPTCSHITFFDKYGLIFSYNVVTGHFNFPEEEKKILAFWKEIDAFQTSVKLSEGRKPFSFYDGPPFATGLPHYGHLLAGTIKVKKSYFTIRLLY